MQTTTKQRQRALLFLGCRNDPLARRTASRPRRTRPAVERNARHALGKPPSGRLTHLVGELAETAAGTRRLLEQTAVRLAGIRAIPDRLVSLARP